MAARRRAAIVAASCLVHAGLAMLLLRLEHRPGGREERTPAAAIAIEVIGVPARAAAADVAGGGSYVATASAAVPLPAAAPQAGRARARVRSRATDRSVLGTAAISPAHAADGEPSAGGTERAGDGGAGGGHGGHRGAGIGFGDGGRIELPRDLPDLPPAPIGNVAPPSKARPAKLIYPSRHREIEDARLFVARVTVDRDGYVVGARLVRGFGGPRDDEATDLIFRFRYAPALDAAGRAIRSTFEQRFHVNR